MPEPTYSAAHTGYKTHSPCDTCGVTIADTARELHTAWHLAIEAAVSLLQCDESCHEADLNTCPKCDTLIRALICDSCRSCAAQDGA